MIAMEELLTIEDVARILRLAPYTVRDMCKRGDLKCTKVGRGWRVKQEDLREYINREIDKK